jgi:lysyl-tRNA synthetase class 2
MMNEQIVKISPKNIQSRVKLRASFLAKARAFFAERGVTEVDPSALVKHPPNDAHIDCFAVDGGGYLHTSPEYAMKRLLAAGSGDIFYLGHVFRKEEQGPIHLPEFTMAEWYRIGISFPQMIDETADFLRLFLGRLHLEHITYRTAFEKYVGIDYSSISLTELQKLTDSQWPRETCLHYLLAHKIEPFLGQGHLSALIDYPPTEAALACTLEKNGEEVAERFEIYYQGIELCNGYHELNNADEIRRRFEAYNKGRQTPYPLDEEFLAALPHLPDCCGVALGFDRALMLHQGLKDILIRH